jgi:hypothetical protein
MFVWLPLRSEDLGRLTRLGISEADFDYFRDTYVGDRFTFVRRRVGSLKHRTVDKRPLSNSELIRHLEGEAWYYTGCAPSTRGHVATWFLVDLDSHQNPSDLWQRYDRIAQVFGYPHLLHRSSTSGGLHLRYFLDVPRRLEDLRRPTGDGGLLIDLLQAAGLEERPGRVELYPRGKYKTGTQNRIRLPFGAGSRLLDPFDPGVPLTCSAIDDLKLAARLERDGKIPRWRAPAAPPERSGTRYQRASPCRPRRRTTARGPRPATAALRHGGLHEAGEFNGAIFRLAQDLAYQGMGHGDAERTLHEWLDNHHNGSSNTYNASPAKAHEEVAAVVARVYASYRPIRPPRPRLSVADLSRIVNATWEDSAVTDPTTGVIYPRLKVQRYLAKIHIAAEQWVLGRASSALGMTWHEVRTQCLAKGVVPDPYPEDLAAIWPDSRVPAFIVPIPYRLRCVLEGTSERQQWSFWRIACASGLLRAVRCASAWGHRAATFELRLDFTEPNGDAQPPFLEAYLARSYSMRDLKRKYSRHYVRVIRQALAGDGQTNGALPTSTPASADSHDDAGTVPTGPAEDRLTRADRDPI